MRSVNGDASQMGNAECTDIGKTLCQTLITAAETSPGALYPYVPTRRPENEIYLHRECLPWIFKIHVTGP